MICLSVICYDAYKISADEKSYTKCFDNDKKSVKGNEECVKVYTLIQKYATEIEGSKEPMVSSDSYQSFIRFSKLRCLHGMLPKSFHIWHHKCLSVIVYWIIQEL